MQTIPLKLALPGMVLAREIKNPENPDGPPLCGKGLALTGTLIERLAQKGVPALTVEGHPVVVEGEQTLDEMLVALDRRFRRVEDDPLMMQLKELYRQQTIRARGA
jgi:hypothetical protein